MEDKPTQASGYESEQLGLVRATCLYVATKLGDMMNELVIIGGLVPSLIIEQAKLPPGVDPHVGTMDLDVGLQLTLLNEGRYRNLTGRLRDAGFSMDKNERGHGTRQRWTVSGAGTTTVTVDFLIPPSREDDQGGKIRDIEPDFAAIIAPGLGSAFLDRISVALEGKTLRGEKAKRDVWVSGPGAYIVLKALAFNNRGENKDAYDLFYVVRNYGSGVEDVVARLEPLLDLPETQQAVGILRRDFTDAESVGPCRVAEFVNGGPDEEVQADVVGFISELLRVLDDRTQSDEG